MQLTAQRNRLAIDTSAPDGVLEVRSGGIPFWRNGGAVQFELALFDKTTLFNDLSNIDQIQLDIKPVSPQGLKTDVALITTNLSHLYFNGALTSAAWAGGAPADCHALLTLSGAQSKMDLGGQDQVQFWLVLTALLLSGDNVILGGTLINCVEDGYGVGAPATVAPPTWLTEAQSDARYLQVIDLTAYAMEGATDAPAAAPADTTKPAFYFGPSGTFYRWKVATQTWVQVIG